MAQMLKTHQTLYSTEPSRQAETFEFARADESTKSISTITRNPETVTGFHVVGSLNGC